MNIFFTGKMMKRRLFREQFLQTLYNCSENQASLFLCKGSKQFLGMGSQPFCDCLVMYILFDELFGFAMIFGSQGIPNSMAHRKSI